MRILAVIPMYANGKAHDKPVAYEVHDVTDPYITRFPMMRDDTGLERQTLQSEVTFKTAEKAQAWIDQQAEYENAKA